jgi:hypothetical protein
VLIGAGPDADWRAKCSIYQVMERVIFAYLQLSGQKPTCRRAERGGDIRVFLAVPHVTAFMRATGSLLVLNRLSSPPPWHAIAGGVKAD